MIVQKKKKKKTTFYLRVVYGKSSKVYVFVYCVPFCHLIGNKRSCTNVTKKTFTSKFTPNCVKYKLDFGFCEVEQGICLLHK